jgi:hypothetical protein
MVLRTNGDGSISNNNIAYQAYFRRVNGGSSSSHWNNVRVVENYGILEYKFGGW